MIKNGRQYRITKAQVRRFEQALDQLSQEASDARSVPPLLRKAERDALRSQLDDLRAELEEYEALRSGKRKVLELASFDEFPRALIQARIAAGLSQRELAHRVGVKEQQIQRYEATEYASASLSRVREVLGVLGVQVQEKVVLPT